MQFYYADPSPDRLVDEVRGFAAQGMLAHPHGASVIAVFLGRVMAAHPERIAGWLAELDGVARDTLRIAAWMSNTAEGRAAVADDPKLREPPADLLACSIQEAQALDLFWAYYLATGEPRAVRRIVSAFELVGDPDANNVAIFQRASQTLVLLMRQHAPLRALVERMAGEPDLTANERQGIALALRATP